MAKHTESVLLMVNLTTAIDKNVTPILRMKKSLVLGVESGF